MNAISIARMLILPPFSLFMLYGIGLLLGVYKPRAGRNLCRSAIAMLFLLSTPAGSWLLVHPLETLARPLSPSSLIGTQAIVVLAAGRVSNSPEYGGQDIPDYIALARLRYTAKLHRKTSLPVLVSGGTASAEDNVKPLADGIVSALQNDFATPVKWSEDKSFNTAENAIFSAKILKAAGIQRILLVTDAMHMQRARMMFEHQGLDVVAAPTMFFSDGELGLADLLPGVEGMRLSNYAIYEWLGIVWYHLRYGA